MNKVIYFLAILNIIGVYSTQAMFPSSQMIKQKLKKLDECIQTRNYHGVEQILKAYVQRIDGTKAFSKIGKALDKYEEYQKEQQNPYNHPRLISALSALICSTFSIGIILFDRKNLFHQFFLSSNACYYGAGALGMLGLKCAFDALYNTIATKNCEQAYCVYATFARYRGNWEMKYRTEPNLPTTKDP